MPKPRRVSAIGDTARDMARTETMACRRIHSILVIRHREPLQKIARNSQLTAAWQRGWRDGMHDNDTIRQNSAKRSRYRNRLKRTKSYNDDGKESRPIITCA